MTVRSVILSAAENPLQVGVNKSWVALQRPDAFNHIPLPSEWARLGEGPPPTSTITAMEVALNPTPLPLWQEREPARSLNHPCSRVDV